ncbi:hypothetical protein VR479_11200 [Aquirufa aurantiipilula]
MKQKLKSIGILSIMLFSTNTSFTQVQTVEGGELENVTIRCKKILVGQYEETIEISAKGGAWYANFWGWLSGSYTTTISGNVYEVICDNGYTSSLRG